MLSTISRRAVKYAILISFGTASLAYAPQYFQSQSLSSSLIDSKNRHKNLPSNNKLIFNIQSDFFQKAKKKRQLITYKTKTPLYKKISSYDGYDLLNLFQENNIDIHKYDMIVFSAKDNFKINIPSAFILKYKPFLAVRDSTLPSGIDWAVVRDEGRIIDGGPYYLMWDMRNTDIPPNFWVFGVSDIILGSFKETYAHSAPSDTNKLNVMRGFQIFQESCAGCHSVNFSGGDFGPEMNVPRNFTEYFTRKFIKSYVKSPQSYRANAKMPPQHSLTNLEVELVIDYLEEMKKNKICSSESTCRKLLEEKLKKSSKN